jgi:serine/threonine protein kinase
MDDAVPRMNTPAPNLMVAPNLRLVMRLGQGGMGSVWLADHLTLHTRVVVKFMAEELANNPDHVARFSREAEAAAQVRSPHVVQMFDHGVTDAGVPYIVMELLEGVDLACHLGIVRRMSPGAVSTLVTQMAAALGRAHKLGIIHRDIKPENVFLTDLGGDELFVKVLDFGIARGSSERLTKVTRDGMILGTPEYMSPERLVRSDATGPAVDLWSLAAVAFEAITGVGPFPGETVAAITLQMHAPKRPAPSAFVPDVPPALDAWFARAFAIDPEARFPDAKTMAEAFAAAQQGAPIRRSRVTPLAPPPSPRRRAPLAACGAFVVAIVAVLALRARSTPAATEPKATPIEPLSIATKSTSDVALAKAEPLHATADVVVSPPSPAAPTNALSKTALTSPTTKRPGKAPKTAPKAPAVFDDVQ